MQRKRLFLHNYHQFSYIQIISITDFFYRDLYMLTFRSNWQWFWHTLNSWDSLTYGKSGIYIAQSLSKQNGGELRADKMADLQRALGGGHLKCAKACTITYLKIGCHKSARHLSRSPPTPVIFLSRQSPMENKNVQRKTLTHNCVIEFSLLQHIILCMYLHMSCIHVLQIIIHWFS